MTRINGDQPADTDRIWSQLTQYRDRLEQTNRVLFVALYGNQNYGLPQWQAFINGVAVVLPDPCQMLSENSADTIRVTVRKRYATGTVRIMDVRDFLRKCLHQSLDGLELLATPYRVFGSAYQEEEPLFRELAGLWLGADPEAQIRFATQQAYHQALLAVSGGLFNIGSFVTAYRLYRFVCRRYQGVSVRQALDLSTDEPDAYQKAQDYLMERLPQRELLQEAFWLISLLEQLRSAQIKPGLARAGYVHCKAPEPETVSQCRKRWFQWVFHLLEQELERGDRQ